ncbi:MAG: GGDEF domain-containing protein [Thermodesulfobacteriota bacterium]
MAAFFATIIGVWKYSQFSQSKKIIDQTSATLVAELEHTFKDSLLVGEIQADLILFIQTAHPETMQEITQKSLDLLSHLPEQARPLLNQFLEQTDTLEIRMASLRLNNNKVLSTGNTIMEALEQNSLCKKKARCLEGVKQAGLTFRQVHPLYMNGILIGQPHELTATKQKISLLLSALKKDLHNHAQELGPQQSRYLLSFIDLFYELDESISTVAAIRERVVTSEKEVVNLFHSLKMQLGEISISRNKQALTLADQGLKLATNYVFLMFAALALVTIFSIAAFAFMSNSILTPLGSLLDLLKKFTTLLRGVRTLSNSEKLQYHELHEKIINRHDEIGAVGRATEALLNHIHSISEFRRKIENDTTCHDVYVRLGKIFRDELLLPSFVMYETSKDKPMEAVYSYPPQLKEEMPDFSVTDTCRAQRTGVVVHSFHDPDICPICQINDALDYFCLPMLAGSEMIGVIQFLLPVARTVRQKNSFQKRLHEAQNYIEEALPIMQAKRYARKLEVIATQDQLTGLYNRHYLEITLPQLEAGIKRRKTSLGILLCDMDHFKAINDTYGHAAGDLALKELADVFRDTLRGSDLIIRYGGEEFLILLLDIEEKEELAVAEKVRQAVANHSFELPDNAKQQTISVGVTEFSGSKPEGGIEKVLRYADIALYKAKEKGRNCVVKFDKENSNSTV